MGGQSVLDGTNLTADFDANGGPQGSSDCNTYSSSYNVNGDSLSIRSPSGTTKLCAGSRGIMDQETAYLNALPSASSFVIEAGQLYINSGGGLIEFVALEP